MKQVVPKLVVIGSVALSLLASCKDVSLTNKVLTFKEDVRNIELIIHRYVGTDEDGAGFEMELKNPDAAEFCTTQSVEYAMFVNLRDASSKKHIFYGPELPPPNPDTRRSTTKLEDLPLWSQERPPSGPYRLSSYQTIVRSGVYDNAFTKNEKFRMEPFEPGNPVLVEGGLTIYPCSFKNMNDAIRAKKVVSLSASLGKPVRVGREMFVHTY
ncbi:hypothetical protein [Aliiroseovarius sp. 2305UL8-7]|uniref:hypothetical protein n=1 Tax=Aliiroseovarius conchicola TaxID=3121637 RepID=UPI0035277BE2